MSAKRFYKAVTIALTDGGYEIRLDGRTLKTPGKKSLLVSNEAVARLIATEWDAQIDTVKPETMPVTRLLNVAVEQTPHNRDALIDEVKNYAGTDLLCYRAENPSDLVARQSERWDPVLARAEKAGLKFNVTHGIIAVDQDPDVIERLGHYAAGLDDMNLTLFVHMVSVYGSAILAWDLFENHITGAEGFALSRLDHDYQIEKWGEDEEATAKTAALAAEVKALCAIREIK